MTPLALIWTPGPMELIVILVIVMIFFGVGKLPQLGAALGKGISGFKRNVDGLTEPDGAGTSTTKPYPYV